MRAARQDRRPRSAALLVKIEDHRHCGPRFEDAWPRRLWAAGAVLLGLGTALVYPTLLAAIGDVAHPSWRASAVGVYRLWRDLGYAEGAALSGIVADVFGLSWAIITVGGLTFLSGIVVAIRMGKAPQARQARYAVFGGR